MRPLKKHNTAAQHEYFTDWSCHPTLALSNKTKNLQDLHCCNEIYHITCGVIQRFPALRKALTSQVKKYDIFSRMLI